MQQLQDRNQKDITKLWNKLGAEGRGDELKLAAHHCLLGVQDTLSHPQDYTLLNSLSSVYKTDKAFQAFKSELESGRYQIHFSLDHVRNNDGSYSIYLATMVECMDGKDIPSQTKVNIEEWAAKIGHDALKTDIERILNLCEHE